MGYEVIDLSSGIVKSTKLLIAWFFFFVQQFESYVAENSVKNANRSADSSRNPRRILGYIHSGGEYLFPFLFKPGSSLL